MPYTPDRRFPAPRAHPPWGEAAAQQLQQLRAAAAQLTAALTSREPHCACSYPALRSRPRPNVPAYSTRYERYESTPGEITLADTEAEIIQFSGTPDSIIVHCRGARALFRFTDYEGREESEYPLDTGATVDTRIARPRVFGRNMLAGNVALVHVTGAWAAPYREPEPR